MQPVQLSLLLEQIPALPTQMIHRLPPPQVREAVAQLAHLIAKMAAASCEVADDE
ncbi:hypothetical protein ABZ468_55555 [Streptomyces sp. NPDC005708]|uniref:hypothetical protein n=1 Tax=Streptomyces sp. NPDC005708 TaxID=3154564 RepID=UPI0033E8B47B